MTARQRGTRWHSTPDAARKSVRLSGVTVPRDVLEAVRLVAGSRRGALSAAVADALRAWLASADILARADEQRKLEALAALDEALALIRTILDADCLQPHAFEKGDDDASVYQACQHLLRIHMR